ncbi:sensor histidine kinase [Aquimarina sp. Aq78]|uniref:sensor histidine kinase n=1 Tax=Aquimarina sp. Aq78 TaxID=1191889 RepID=UPI00131B88BE|nr:sensor histidine kinase [Aquimarina sp. Aq78]
MGHAKTDVTNFDTFFYHLKNLELNKAKEDITSVQDDKASELLTVLLDLLYDAGQTTNESYYDSIQLRDSTEINNSIYLLLQGYKELYYHPVQANAYQYFSDGYVLAKKIGYKPLEKQFLLGLLELYHSEILQSNQQYISYLSDFENLIEDDIDRFWFLLYTSILDSKTISEIDQLSSSSLNKLALLVSNTNEISDVLLTKFYYEKAVYYGFDRNFKDARVYYAKVIPHVKKPFLKYMAFGSFIRLGVMDSEEGNLNNALKHLDSASRYIDSRDTLKSFFYIDRYKADFYARSKQFDSAYVSLNKSLDAEYQLQYRKNSLEISRMNVLYETEKKERQLLEERQKTKQNQNFLIIALVIIGLGSLVAILLQKNTSKKQKLAEQEREIQKRKVATLLKEQELLSIDAMIEGQEKERQRVANELHDDLGSLMATVRLYFENIKVDKKDNSLEKASELLEEAYQKIRGMAHSKNSGVIASQGLIPAVMRMAKSISETNTIVLEVHNFGMEERMENSLELTIFRIIQELVTNIVKHAEATAGSIQFTKHEESLNILIEDNGRGFNFSKIEASSEGIGLYNIEKRIEHLEGNFTIDSTPGKGTSIIIDIPL